MIAHFVPLVLLSLVRRLILVFRVTSAHGARWKLARVSCRTREIHFNARRDSNEFSCFTLQLQKRKKLISPVAPN